MKKLFNEYGDSQLVPDIDAQPWLENGWTTTPPKKPKAKPDPREKSEEQKKEETKQQTQSSQKST